MIEEILTDFGFPAFVAGILLWDKIKTNNSLKVVVDNNNEILKKIEKHMRCYNG